MKLLRSYGQWTRVQDGAEAEYRRLHEPGAVPGALLELVTKSGFSDYSIFMRGRSLYSSFKAFDANEAGARMSIDPVFGDWMERMAHLMDADDPLEPWQPMELVFRHE